MKYIGTVVSDTVQPNKRAETTISIEGLPRPQQIVIIWSHNRTPDALAELTAGTRVIFAAKEDTLTQRTDDDETTGAVVTVLVAVGLFYDIITDDRDATDIYTSIEPRPLTFSGTVATVETVGKNRGITLVMPRHGQAQPIETRWPADIADSVADIRPGDEITVEAGERSLSWRVSIDDLGRRAVVPVVTATALATSTILS